MNKINLYHTPLMKEWISALQNEKWKQGEFHLDCINDNQISHCIPGVLEELDEEIK